MCVIVCPFGVIAREMESKIIIKCDRCPDRDEPACVEACPVSALTFTDLEEIEKGKRRGVIKNILVGGLRAS
jgi:carbon-monoxide dehydrogenase iron sulfur subunit